MTEIDYYSTTMLPEQLLEQVRALHQRGTALAIAGRREEAIDLFQQALRLSPGHLPTLSNLGAVLKECGRFDEAIDCCRRMIVIAPNEAAAHLNLGIAQAESGRSTEAIASAKRATELAPNQPQAWNLLGLIQVNGGKVRSAVVAYEKALALAPQFADAQANLATALLFSGEQDRAVTAAQRAVDLAPNSSKIHSNLLLTMQYASDQDPGKIFAAHRQWSQRHEREVRRPQRSRANARLRIGFHARYFATTPTTFFMQPILQHLDRRRFELFCFCDVRNPDATTQRFRGYHDHVRPIAHLNDAQAAQLIARENIDILFDLFGHTDGNRLPMFALKPAPIQITFLGYPDTTGLRNIDYRITDAIADPPGAEMYHSEKLIRLSECAWCYSPAADLPELTPHAGGPIRFGCFNSISKITTRTMELWKEILQRLPQSRLVLKSPYFEDDDLATKFRAIFGERVDLLPHDMSYRDHLNQYNSIDIALDSFPYHGTTTTCEALAMGVPVVTQLGGRHVSRVGASLLTTVGLQELIAANEREYVDRAVSLAQDRNRLADLHAKLRQQVMTSHLCDAKKFVANFTDALEAICPA